MSIKFLYTFTENLPVTIFKVNCLKKNDSEMFFNRHVCMRCTSMADFFNKLFQLFLVKAAHHWTVRNNIFIEAKFEWKRLEFGMHLFKGRERCADRCYLLSDVDPSPFGHGRAKFDHLFQPDFELIQIRLILLKGRTKFRRVGQTLGKTDHRSHFK